MKVLFLSICLVFSAAFNSVTAQTKEADKYRKESDEVRKQVWAWDKPQFESKTCTAAV